MAEHVACGITQGNAQITLDPHLHEGTIEGKQVLDADRVVAHRAQHHLLAWSTGQFPLQVVMDMISGPVSERAYSRVDLGELGDEGMVDIDGRGKAANQVLEEFLAGALGRSFDNGAEGGKVVAGHRLRR